MGGWTSQARQASFKRGAVYRLRQGLQKGPRFESWGGHGRPGDGLWGGAGLDQAFGLPTLSGTCPAELLSMAVLGFFRVFL